MKFYNCGNISYLRPVVPDEYSTTVIFDKQKTNDVTCYIGSIHYSRYLNIFPS